MNKRIFSLMGLLWLMVSLTSMTNQTSQRCERVSQQEFKQQLNTLQDVQLIDVRTAGEHKKGTIGQAQNIDFMSPNFGQLIAQLDKTKPTLIFCQSGGRSAKALIQFKKVGFQFVLELEGGYGSWKK